VEVLLDEVDVVEDAAAAIAEPAVAAATCVEEDDAGVDVLVEEDEAGVDVLVEAVDEGLKGTAGVGGASVRMNIVKLTTSEFKSDGKLALGGLKLSTELVVSSGSGLGAHCEVAGVVRFGMTDMFRLFGNRSLVTPSSTL
jgi:hypothetical protein